MKNAHCSWSEIRDLPRFNWPPAIASHRGRKPKCMPCLFLLSTGRCLTTPAGIWIRIWIRMG